MTTPSKQVLERAKERGFEHLDGPYFKRGSSFYFYNPSTEAMSIANEDDYREYVQEKEAPRQESLKEEPEPEPEVLTDIEEPTDTKILQAMEIADERQIAQEIKGQVIEEYFYSFQAGSREVIGLSYAGVKQVAREMARREEPIDIEELVKEESDTHFTVTAKSVNRQTGEHRFGVGRQSKTQTFRDGTTKEDEYALQKAVSKGQRNAIRAFIPENIIVEMYRAWKKQREERERF